MDSCLFVLVFTRKIVMQRTRGGLTSIHVFDPRGTTSIIIKYFTRHQNIMLLELEATVNGLAPRVLKNMLCLHLLSKKVHRKSRFSTIRLLKPKCECKAYSKKQPSPLVSPAIEM